MSINPLGLYIVDSIIIITDRINLDGQLKGTVGATEKQKKMIAFVEKTTELADALNENTKVIITTIQKFSVKKLNVTILEKLHGKIQFGSALLSVYRNFPAKCS